ncbi:hypothetical protein [Streptomyces sp. NPDC019224]|uniref:hypothetical protein n=1 Tax=Streptomyces sp. NPDC019224 TaxID=3154484 RepID=UPI0033F309CF
MSKRFLTALACSGAVLAAVFATASATSASQAVTAHETRADGASTDSWGWD